MNRFAIYSLLALFCISFAPTQAEFEIYRRIESARTLLVVDSIPQSYPDVFYRKDVHLYKNVDAQSGKAFYKVGEQSRRFSSQFLIDQRSTVVTNDEILIGYEEVPDRKYAVVLDVEGDPFRFYQELFSFENSPKELRAKRISRLWFKYDITTIKAKNGEGGEWSFMALAGDTPCLIFPAYRVSSVKWKMFSKKVTFLLREKLDSTGIITVEFDTSRDADDFHKFLKELTVK